MNTVELIGYYGSDPEFVTHMNMFQAILFERLRYL